MYAKGMSTKQISETIEEIYGFEASESFISDVTDKILPQIEDWQNRPPEAVYPIVFVDAIHFSVREDGVVQKRAAYVVLGVDADGRKDVLTIDVGENESSKYRLSVLNSLKNRGVQNRLILNKGCHFGCIPENRAPALYRTYGQEHIEVCGEQRHEVLREGPEDDLYSSRRKGRTDAA